MANVYLEAGQLHARVVARLEWLGLRQKDLALAMGVPPPTLSQYLRTRQPRVRTVMRIARALGLHLEDLTAPNGTIDLYRTHPGLAGKGTKGSLGAAPEVRKDRVRAMKKWYRKDFKK